MAALALLLLPPHVPGEEPDPGAAGEAGLHLLLGDDPVDHESPLSVTVQAYPSSSMTAVTIELTAATAEGKRAPSLHLNATPVATTEATVWQADLGVHRPGAVLSVHATAVLGPYGVQPQTQGPGPDPGAPGANVSGNTTVLRTDSALVVRIPDPTRPLWHEGSEDTLAMAAALGRPAVLVICRPIAADCRQLRDRSFSGAEVVRQTGGVVMGRVDPDSEPLLVLGRDVRATPMTLLLASNGSEVGRLGGVPSERALVAALQVLQGQTPAPAGLRGTGLDLAAPAVALGGGLVLVLLALGLSARVWARRRGG